jgi:post-segregation antitoxin (ccd killing protein)
VTTPRNRGPRWSSPKQADRGRPGRMIYLPRDLHAALDRLRDAKANVSAIAEEALRAHPKVAAELARGATDETADE